MVDVIQSRESLSLCLPALSQWRPQISPVVSGLEAAQQTGVFPRLGEEGEPARSRLELQAGEAESAAARGFNFLQRK